MTKNIKRVIDRSSWGAGPWSAEPDRLEWRTAVGYPGLMVRNDMGNWCGYAAVLPDHPALRRDDLESILDVHGGVTYGPNRCQGDICHVPEPGAPDAGRWIGFDCAHCGDRYNLRENSSGGVYSGGVYRDVPYVRAEVEKLAAQLKALESTP